MKEKVFISKAVKGIFFTLLSFLILNCNQIREKDLPGEPCKSENQNVSDALNISKEIAVLIARAKVSSDYDLKQYDEVVIDNETSWTVSFVFKPEYRHWTGGEPSVEIDKKTGDVLKWYFPK
jgi:hypothetical protein